MHLALQMCNLNHRTVSQMNAACIQMCVEKLQSQQKSFGEQMYETTTTTLKRCIALYKWYVVVCSPHRFWHTGKKCCQCHVNGVVLLYGATSYIPSLRMFRRETKRRKTRKQQLQLNRAISRNGNESGDHGS